MIQVKLPSFLCLHLWLLFTSQFSRGINTDTMLLGTSLSPSSTPLQSSSSAFLLSFRPPPAANASSSSNLYLAISFAVAKEGPPAWVAYRAGDGFSSNAKLTLLANGNLILFDSNLDPTEPIWATDTSQLGVVRAQLLDSGNFVLLNNYSEYVWESFLEPADTLLPTQKFTNDSFKLRSSYGVGFFKMGNYALSFSSTGLLQLSSISQPGYYWADWGIIYSFWFDLVESNIILRNSSSSSIQTLHSVVNGSSSTFRLTLDVDGNLRLYVWDTALREWKSIWMAIVDVCSQVSGLCGSYGICMLNPQPTCVCPPGFTAKDPTLLFAGCERNHAINCSTLIKYAEIEGVDFSNNDYKDIANLSVEECKEQCSNVCSCEAAVFLQAGNYGQCWLKESVENGNYDRSNQMFKVFLKLSANDPSVVTPLPDTAAKWTSQILFQPHNTTPPLSAITTQYNTTTISNNHTEYRASVPAVIALSAVIGAQAFCFAATCLALLNSRKKQRYRRLRGDLEAVSRSPSPFSYQEVEAATKNFSHELGAGSFGTVYKGKLQDGMLVAVKKLEGVSQQEKQFRAEIATLGHVHHINLLRLVGFCSEGSHRLLVYEFMENGSLDQVLFEKGRNAAQISVLDWRTRFQICLGVARGVHYLHEECLDCILHFDIKPQNILLDGSYTAKVADFGLAYLFNRDHTVKMTTIRGTRGYMAPEWVLNLPITAKADVFSYGMLVMEILSGRANYIYTESAMMDTENKWCFPTWAYGKKVEEVIDPRMDAASMDYNQAELVMKVAFACAQGDRNARPSMGRVVQMLVGMLAVPDSPAPSLFADVHLPSPSSSSSKSKAPSFPDIKAADTNSSSSSTTYK